MSKISIANLNPAGSNLFSDSESYMTDVADIELEHVNGGFWSFTSPICAVLSGASTITISLIP